MKPKGESGRSWASEAVFAAKGDAAAEVTAAAGSGGVGGGVAVDAVVKLKGLSLSERVGNGSGSLPAWAKVSLCCGTITGCRHLPHLAFFPRAASGAFNLAWQLGQMTSIDMPITS
jgi:hypothetical protein